MPCVCAGIPTSPHILYSWLRLYFLTNHECTPPPPTPDIAAGRAQMETELRVDGELNEEELQRAADAAQKQVGSRGRGGARAGDWAG